MRSFMMNYLAVVLLLISLCLAAGCGNNQDSDGTDLFVSDDEYLILDEGEKNHDGAEVFSKEPSNSNTNAKTSSEKKKEVANSTQIPSSNSDKSAPSEKPSHSSNSTSGSGKENELPLVPAEDISSDSNSSDNASSIELDD